MHYKMDMDINSATDRSRYVLEHRFTEVSEIMQCNGQVYIGTYKTNKDAL